MADGGNYTVAVLGLLVLESFDDADADDGFLGWLRDLFGEGFVHSCALHANAIGGSEGV